MTRIVGTEHPKSITYIYTCIPNFHRENANYYWMGESFLAYVCYLSIYEQSKGFDVKNQFVWQRWTYICMYIWTYVSTQSAYWKSYIFAWWSSKWSLKDTLEYFLSVRFFFFASYKRRVYISEFRFSAAPHYVHISMQKATLNLFNLCRKKCAIHGCIIRF